MAVTEGREGAQGSLRVLGPRDLLRTIARNSFTGRLILISAGTPRRVVALHLAGGQPRIVAGTGIPHGLPPADESYHARQVLLAALGWTMGSFRIESHDATAPSPISRQSLGHVNELLRTAEERTAAWALLRARLPQPLDDLLVAPNHTSPPDDATPEQTLVMAAVVEPVGLREVARATRLDEHVALTTILDLVDSGHLSLGTDIDMATAVDPGVSSLAERLLLELQPEGSNNKNLKITVLSWDAKTCFRAVEALIGRGRRPPADVEDQPRYQILHESASLADGVTLEILAFRSDAFEPAFAAPLVHDCHIFLLFTDIDAGHLWGTEKPLVDRVNSIREMFRGTSVAGRITVGAGAVTDPGIDVLLPELGRYIAWGDISTAGFLPEVLREVADRLGVGA